MIDLKIGLDGDLVVSETGDISLTESIRQAVLIRLRWIYGEWRLGPDLGFPWFDEVFVKNPDTVKIRGMIRSEIVEVDGVNDANVESAVFDPASRNLTVRYIVYTDEGTFREEVTLYGELRDHG